MAAFEMPRGVGVALVSLFDTHDRLDVGATSEHAGACAERGVTSILVAGTTGEPWRMRGAHDRIELAAAIRATGAIVALANTMPETCAAAWTGNVPAQRRLFNTHLDSLIAFPASLKPGAAR